MGKNHTIELIDRERYVALAAEYLDHNYRQSWAYSQALAARRKAQSEHVAILRGGEVIGVCEVRVKQLPVVGGGLAYISGGPLVRRGRPEDAAVLAEALEALVGHYSRRRGLVLRVLGTLGTAEWNEAATGAFRAAGFVPTSRSAVYRTLVVDLRRPLEEIRKSLLQKWRNCLNSGERKVGGVRVGTSVGMFEEFERLFASFVGRKGFHVDLGPDFFRSCQDDAPENEKCVVSLAEIGGKVVAGHVGTMLGDTAVYLLGATCEEGLKSNAAYVLQWNAIKLAKERGMSFYDLGGIDPEENPNVYHFKQGMAGADVTAPGPFEWAPRTLRGRLALGAEAAYQSARKRRQAGAAKAGN